MGGIGLDSEVTGVDIHHGATPYFVTISDEQFNNSHWEWDVVPQTRKVKVHKQDSEEIAHTILAAEYVVIQNAKYDIGALTPILPKDFKWPYEVIHDTTYTAHLIASNRAKDLTSLALDYLSIDITQYEEDIEAATNKCRNLVRRKNSPIGDWLIAKKGLACMPSAKDKCWKYDMWLPKAVATWAAVGTPKERSDKLKWLGVTPTILKLWGSLVASYANVDSSSCLAIFLKHKQIIEERGLIEIYEARRQFISCIVDIESKGVTGSYKRLKEKQLEFKELNTKAAATCINLAKTYSYELELPKGGRNNSLSNFVFDVLKVPSIQIGNQRNKKSSVPSLDRKCIDYWIDTLPERSKQLKFITTLIDKKATDNALSYLESYESYGLPTNDLDTFLLHPSFNATGTNTLRMSSANPNAQNISKREGFGTRYIFGPAPNREWWSIDYENLELRIPGYECGEPAMLELFEKPNEPPFYGSYHLLIFSILHPEKYDHDDAEGLLKAKDKYKPTWYQWTKNGNFADLYGAQEASGTADIAFHVPGAQRIISKKLTHRAALNKKYIDFANEYGYVETLPDRTINPNKGYPLLCTRTSWGGVLGTVPLNYHVQGCLQGSSKVLTTKGLIPIEDLVNNEVEVWTGFKWAKAIGLNRGKYQLAKIKLSSGLTINCDTRHKLKNENDKWVEFKNLKVGDLVALPTNPNPLEPSKEINWAFVFGFITGDGCISNSKRKGVGITGGEIKLPILKQIHKFLGEQGYVGSYGGVRWGIRKATKSRSTKYAVSLENKQFATFMESKGFVFGWTSKTKHIPNYLWTATFQEHRDFLEGLWMSDGTRAFCRGSGKGLNMANRKLLEEVQILSSNLGFDAHFKGPQLRFRWRGFGAKSSRKYPAKALLAKVKQLDKHTYEYPNDFVVDKRVFNLTRQGKDPSQYVAERILGNNSQYSVYRYDKIVSIEVLNKYQNTYTMSVDDELHQFVADGVIHANTACWVMMKAMIKIKQYLDSINNGSYMAINVHDEIVLDLPVSKRNQVTINTVKRIMEKEGDNVGIRLTVNAERHSNNWASKG